MKRKTKTTLAITGLLILSFLLYSFITPYPNTRKFYKLISESDRIVIKEFCVENETFGWKEIFESEDPEDIKSFGNSLILKKQSRFVRSYCKCLGTHSIYFYKNGKESIHITNHHNESIRSDLWEGNVSIANVDKWNTWLDSHLITNEEK